MRFGDEMNVKSSLRVGGGGVANVGKCLVGEKLIWNGNVHVDVGVVCEGR